uniref:Uncharacterized protein n=1 Tax=Heterorhabditis bacteriophora TaxID=37862 RepID=A0A1I7XQD4_HETBA
MSTSPSNSGTYWFLCRSSSYLSSSSYKFGSISPPKKKEGRNEATAKDVPPTNKLKKDKEESKNKVSSRVVTYGLSGDKEDDFEKYLNNLGETSRKSLGKAYSQNLESIQNLPRVELAVCGDSTNTGKSAENDDIKRIREKSISGQNNKDNTLKDVELTKEENT